MIIIIVIKVTISHNIKSHDHLSLFLLMFSLVITSIGGDMSGNWESDGEGKIDTKKTINNHIAQF